MPVKLNSESNAQDAMSISLAEYNQGRANFTSHYYRSSCNTNFGGQDLQIPWDTLQTDVNNFIANAQTTDVALRMVYCFDGATNALYLRIQICRMDELEQSLGTYALITTGCSWYKLWNGTLITTPDTSLQNAAYLNSFYYCANPPCTGTNVQQLAADTQATLYARTITFPWTQEILQMYIDNGSPTGAKICFGSTSYVHANSGESNVAFPHGLVLYLRNSAGQPFLDNNDTISVFHNKGVDYGTLCPNFCNVYVLPKV